MSAVQTPDSDLVLAGGLTLKGVTHASLSHADDNMYSPSCIEM